MWRDLRPLRFLKNQPIRRPFEHPVLKRRAFLFQKLKLFRRAGAAEYGVAVRVAAEAVDDGFVLFFMYQGMGGVAGKEFQREGVDFAAFAVHERHQHHVPPCVGQIGETGLFGGFLGKHLRHGVAGEGLRVVAEQVARELVEHDDFRQAAFKRGAPSVEFGAGGMLPKVGKAAMDGLVEFGAFGEPEGAVFFGEPKIEYGLWGHIGLDLLYRVGWNVWS